MNTRIGENRCSLCGAEFDPTATGQLRTMIVGASGKPNAYVVSAGGVEIHRCELDERQMQQVNDSVNAQAS